MDCVHELYANKDLSLLKKLTLIIPTHNRNFYLSRCLWYHGHFPFAEIIVADSSVEDKRVVNRETVQKIRDMFGAHITYLEYDYPAEEYGGEIYRKWGDSVQHTVTDYSEFCTDKEFLIPTEICASIQFLIDHLDYVTAEGCVYQIREYPKGTREYNPWQDVPSVISDNPHERLYTALERTTGTLFSVYHTNILKMIYDNLNKYSLYDIRFGETALEIQPLILGKIYKDLTSPMRCRDIRHTKDPSPIISKIEKNESSFTRYRKYNEYPKERFNQLGKNLEMCIYDLLADMNDGKKQLQWDGEQLVQKILDKRYNSDYGLYNKYPLIQQAWNIAPIPLQRWFLKLMKEKRMYFSSSEISPEVDRINLLIEQFEKYYADDLPIY